MISIEEIRTIALGLPGSFEQASYGGRPSWRTKRRMFTWVRDEPEALVVWVDSIDERDALAAAEPDTFFTTSPTTTTRSSSCASTGSTTRKPSS